MIQTINIALYRSMIMSGAALLEQNKQKINDLNVFPVPDGDTGTNMSLTLNAGANALRNSSFDSVGIASEKLASALLRGARGNSGVILSLLFRGMAKSLKDKTSVNTTELASALYEGVQTAYNAVMKPTEGTILTVSRLIADAAVEFAETGDDMESMFEHMITAGSAALDATIEQNPVLKKAGVVDAGGEGYLIILRGMLFALRGQPVESEYVEDLYSKADFGAIPADEITFAFDTVFIVRKTEKKSLAPLREYLDGIGDSLVIGEDDEAFKVHVHTNTPGNALNEAQKYGTLELAKIENMRTQRDDLAAGKKTQTAEDIDNENLSVSEPDKAYGVVSVCAGDGMAEIFSNLGVDAIVTGGQTMNPSTDDILNAVNSVSAKTVFVLPNNKNIIMAAQQCIGLTDKNVIVIPSKTVPQGISAMVSFDDTLAEEELTNALTDACSTVHTVLITYAARDSEFEGLHIKAGEYLALLEGALIGSDSDLALLLGKVSDALSAFSPDILTVYYGENVDTAAASTLLAKLSSRMPDTETLLVNGGQPVYYYMISAE